MSDKITGLYLEQIAQRISDDIEELKEHVPSESNSSPMIGAPKRTYPSLENLRITRDFVETAATLLMRDK